jgi:SAM-dependent methyltransferase
MNGIQTIKFATLIFSSLLSLDCISQEIEFEAYPAEETYQGKSHALAKEDDHNDRWSSYRKKALGKPVNFAGKYIILEIGCGGGAICGEILDAASGKLVTTFPNAYEIDSYASFYKKNSRLLYIEGETANAELDEFGNEMSFRNRGRYYELKGNKLNIIKITEQP